VNQVVKDKNQPRITSNTESKSKGINGERKDQRMRLRNFDSDSCWIYFSIRIITFATRTQI